MPEKRFDKSPCRASDSATPATDSTATRLVTGMPSVPAMMMTAMTHSTAFIALRKNDLRLASMCRLESRIFSNALHSIFITM